MFLIIVTMVSITEDTLRKVYCKAVYYQFTNKSTGYIFLSIMYSSLVVMIKCIQYDSLL